MAKQKRNWIIALIILTIATIIDLAIPDPVPVVDEVILIALTLYAGYRSL